MSTFMAFILFFPIFADVQSVKSAPLKKHPKGTEVRILTDSVKHKNQNAFIGHLTIPPLGKVPLHQDRTEEYLFVLEGRGTIWINGTKSNISEDDLVFMPADSKVRFENGPKPFRVLQVFAPLGPEKKYDSWKEVLKPGVKKK